MSVVSGVDERGLELGGSRCQVLLVGVQVAVEGCPADFQGAGDLGDGFAAVDELLCDLQAVGG